MESTGIIPGCKEEAQARAPAACMRLYQHNSEFHRPPDVLGHIPYGNCWVSRSSVAQAATYPKAPRASVIASWKSATTGQRLLHNIVAAVRGMGVDVYGSGFGPHLADKSLALLPYQYAIIIENSKETGWWTEKLGDCVSCRCVAFYWGAPNVHDWFDAGSVVAFDTIEELVVLLGQMSDLDYASRTAALDANQHRGRARQAYLNNLAIDTDLLSLPVTVTSSCSMNA